MFQRRFTSKYLLTALRFQAPIVAFPHDLSCLDRRHAVLYPVTADGRICVPCGRMSLVPVGCRMSCPGIAVGGLGQMVNGGRCWPCISVESSIVMASIEVPIAVLRAPMPLLLGIPDKVVIEGIATRHVVIAI